MTRRDDRDRKTGVDSVEEGRTCATDAGVESVTALLAATAPGLGASGLDRKTPPDQVVTLSAEDREIMKELGVTEEQYRKANGLAAA